MEDKTRKDGLNTTLQDKDPQIYTENVAPQDRDTQVVRACAIEMHLGISDEPPYTEIYR